MQFFVKYGGNVAATLLGILLWGFSKPLAEPSLPFDHEWVKELHCMYTAVYYEARGEPDEGKKGVMQVILNRARLRKQSLCEVVTAPHQFVWYSTKISLAVDENTLARYNEVARIDAVVSADTQYFHSGKKPVWAGKLQWEKTIGGHHFYKTKGEINE